MKALAFSLLLLIGAPSVQAADERPWQQTLLFDWLYPGEPAYEALKAAATQLNSQDWIASRLARGERVPQASARELAYKLSQSPDLGADLKARLDKTLADEGIVMSDKGDGSADKRAKEISAKFDEMSKRMDEIEAIYDNNRYFKGSFPAVNFDAWTSYRLDNPGGMIQRDTRGYMVGGLGFTLRGTLDKANYSLSIGTFYSANQDSDNDFSEVNGLQGAAFSFVLPLDNGGLDVTLGGGIDLKMSALLLSGANPANRDGFFIEVFDAYRAPKDVKILELNYPFATITKRGVGIKRQGATWYWPFTNTHMIYAIDNDFWQNWNNKIHTLAMRLDEDFGPRGAWVDRSLLFGMLTYAYNDADLVRTVPAASVGAKTAQSSFSYGFGGEIGLSSGTSFRAEGALSHYKRAVTVPEDFEDSAWIANLVQPVGPVNFALEGGMAGPRFITKDRAGAANSTESSDRTQSGATLDSTWNNVFPNAPTGPANLTWISLMKNPQLLSNNSSRAVLKAEWHGSFLSLGLYDGVANQINPSGPFVMTAPYIEGSAGNGYGWFKAFGQQYSPAPAPFTLGVGTPGNIAMGRYNRPTDGMAIYDNAGNSVPVHWQEIGQRAYREGQFTFLLSEKGVGNARLMQDSIKVTNYLGGTVRFDFKGVFDMVLPLDLVVVGENRDLAANAGLPSFDGSNYFNQRIVVGFLTVGLHETANFVATAGYEAWQSNQSYYPLNVIVREYGAGFDFKLDPLISSLVINLRATLMQHEDLNLTAREFSLNNISIGSTLSY